MAQICEQWLIAKSLSLESFKVRFLLNLFVFTLLWDEPKKNTRRKSEAEPDRREIWLSINFSWREGKVAALPDNTFPSDF